MTTISPLSKRCTSGAASEPPALAPASKRASAPDDYDGRPLTAGERAVGVLRIIGIATVPFVTAFAGAAVAVSIGAPPEAGLLAGFFAAGVGGQYYFNR